MKKINLLCFLFFIGSSAAFAQFHWDSLLGEPKNPEGLRYVYGDSNYLYASGSFTSVGGVPMNGIARWNGIKWDSMGAGINSTQLSWGDICGLIPYHNKLYACGIFYSLGNVTAYNIGRWNGTAWESIPIQPFTTGNGSNAVGVGSMIVENNKLYIAGSFDSIAGQANVFNVACWNDTNWSSLNFPNLRNFYTINALCEYNGSIYAAGEFYGNVPDDTNSGILRWDGTSWHSVGGGINGDPDVYSMVVYNGELYVAGIFSSSVGSNIQRWNGTTWRGVGGGTDYEIFDLLVYNGKLYAMGQLSMAGGIPASCIAEWDGTQWCSLGSTFDNTIVSGCIYKDSLYIGGGFSIIDGHHVGDIDEWIGGNYTSACGNNATGIYEAKDESEKINVYPNPSNGQFVFDFNTPVNGVIEVYDITGREVYKQTVQSENTEINLSGQPAGMYFYRTISNTGSLIGEGKIVIER